MGVASAQGRERSLDIVATGGAGAYVDDTVTRFQPTANVDFYAQTSILDLMAGVHGGFGDPFTKSFTVGLRFPVSGTATQGLYLDAGLLFFDAGTGEQAFSTGLRAALAGRVGSLNVEYRVAGEARQIFGGPLRLWGGVEAGFFLNLLHERVRDPSRKDSLLAQLSYIATTGELDQLRAAWSDIQIDSFLAQFWRSRDLTPGTPINEAKLEYERRVRTADSNYSTPRQMGVETDMGRVFLLYGEPNNIESASSTIEPGRHYQLWIYQGRIKGYGTAVFLFRNDAGGFDSYSHGDYRQVYSNIPGEPSDLIPNDIPASMRNFILSTH